MREHIHTIPIWDAFRDKAGCPFCALEVLSETRLMSYLLDGESVMDPSVRSLTTRRGFCHEHLSKLLTINEALGLALLLEARLAGLAAFMNADSRRVSMHLPLG